LNVIEDVPHQWVKNVLTAETPTVLFLDELTRCRSVQIMNMLTEFVLERTFNGHPISEHVQLICATNLYDEDNGLVEVPDAVMNRMTHIVFAPEASEAAAHMRTELGKQVLLQQPAVLRVPGIPDLNLDGNPRQVDDIVDLWNTKLLSKDDLHLVARGRVGKEKGPVVAATILDITRQTELALPLKLTYQEFKRVAAAEAGGMGIEVVNLLKATVEAAKYKGKSIAEGMVADYLVQHATPETCRAMQAARFYYQYPKEQIPTEPDGADIENVYDGRKLLPGMPVQYYLIAKKKLVDKATGEA
jgi:MoxR-like ATPase